MDGAWEGAKTVDPEEFLRSALEKIVFFECRVSQLESELAAARTVAERARGDAAQARQRETELEQAIAGERGARVEAEDRAAELQDRVRLLEAERERLLGGLVERARLSGATGSDGAPGPEEGGADLAGFIAELRAEIESLRAWKAAALASGVAKGEEPAATPVPAPADARAARHESVAAVAGRFASGGRVGLTARDTDQMKALLVTRADRALYERSMDDLSATDAGRRLRAVRALEALGSKAAAPLLAAALGREADAEVKAALLTALARFKEPFAADLAARALEDTRPSVRVAALEALAAVASGAAEERLADALADESPLVRRRAALLLGFTKGPRADEALAAALADPDRGVARAAAAALSGRPSARAQGALARGLEHPDASVRRAAAHAISPLAGETVDVDAPASQRRATSRRIAERLAAMGTDELRAAVFAAVPAARAAKPTAAPIPVATATVRQDPPSNAQRSEAGGEGRGEGGRVDRGPARAESPVTLAPIRSGGEGVPGERGRSSSTPAQATASRTARTAVAVVEPANLEQAVQRSAAAGGAESRDELSQSIVFEVRAALRGCTADHLAGALGAPAAAVDAALAALAARGTLVQRGARWFMS